MLYLEIHRLEAQQRNQVERSRTLAGVDEILALEHGDVIDAFQAKRRCGVDHPAGRTCHCDLPVLVFVADTRIAEQIGELRRGRRPEDHKAVGLGARGKEVAALGRAAAWFIDDDDDRVARQILAQQLCVEAAPGVRATTGRERNDPLDRLAREIGFGCSRASKAGRHEPGHQAQRGAAAQRVLQHCIILPIRRSDMPVSSMREQT